MLAARTTLILHSAVIALILCVAGCESMPVQEMSDARQAIMAARDAGADQHASNQLQAAEAALQSAEQSLNSKNYGVARREAIEAKSQALEALKISETAQGDEN